MTVPAAIAVTDVRIGRVETACRALARGVGQAPSIGELARDAGVSAASLRRDFAAVLGVTPKQYADQLRVERLRDGLRAGNDVTTAQYDAGYGSSGRLYEHAGSRLGMTPASYGARGKGASIAFTTCRSSFGLLLVAATKVGVCRILLGNDELALEACLRDEFSAARVERDDDRLRDCVVEVLHRVDGVVPARELPLDVRGTAFQRRVWQALQGIPRGRTESYGEVAESVGVPGGARAVGAACGANPVPFVVPCHRVVAANGGFGGYALGLDVKRGLLAAERDAEDAEDQVGRR